jgi:hypothetical protein
MNFSRNTKVFGLVSLALASATAHGQLFESNYTAHAQAFSLADDEVASISLNGPVSFYGSSYNSLSLSTNGNINFSGNNDFFGTAFPSTSAGPVIAPLWSDWFADNQISADYSRVFYDDNASRFIATWDVRLVDDESVKAVFQAVLDKASGQIKFGYGTIDSRYMQYANANGNRTGLNAGDGLRFADNVQNGAMSNIQRFYSYDASAGNYNAVPEPATMFAVGLGLAVAARRRRR